MMNVPLKGRPDAGTPHVLFDAIRNKFFLLLVVAAPIGVARAAWTDGMVQYWDFSRGTSGSAAAKNDIRDALTCSAAKTLVATRVDGDTVSETAKELQEPVPVGFRDYEVQLPFYGNVTNTRTCLYIPQETAIDGTTTKYFSRQVRLPAPASRANFGPMSVFLRFYIEKQNISTSQMRSLYEFGGTRAATTGGWGLALYGGNKQWPLQVSFGHDWSRASPSEVYGKTEPTQGVTTPYVYAERWYDLVVTVDPTTTTNNIDLYLCQAGKIFRDPSTSYYTDYRPDMYHYRLSRELTAPASESANCQILAGGVSINGWGGLPAFGLERI